MTDKQTTDTILQLSNNSPIFKDVSGEIDRCSIFGRLHEYKMDVLRNVIEKIENRLSIDSDWPHIVIVVQQGSNVTMTSKEEIYYKQMQVGTLSFRMEKFTAFLDFTPV